MKKGTKVQILRDVSLYDPATFQTSVRAKSGANGTIKSVATPGIFMVALDGVPGVVPFAEKDLKEVK